ncbi:hypothetical protein BKA70DRAFT_1226508 [Coprinopsis sp. MPI-PUGE-AT-0042]|nr:hypothetical protein BKA70DRAFT_1226508 [Coprinopsis sp. MPI-PUGE-AT-0042]
MAMRTTEPSRGGQSFNMQDQGYMQAPLIHLNKHDGPRPTSTCGAIGAHQVSYVIAAIQASNHSTRHVDCWTHFGDDAMMLPSFAIDQHRCRNPPTSNSARLGCHSDRRLPVVVVPACTVDSHLEGHQTTARGSAARPVSRHKEGMENLDKSEFMHFYF